MKKLMFYSLATLFLLAIPSQADEPGLSASNECREAYNLCLKGKGCHFENQRTQEACLNKGCNAAVRLCTEEWFSRK